MRSTINDYTLLSLYTTAPAQVITGDKSGVAKAIEVDVSYHGKVRLYPAP